MIVGRSGSTSAFWVHVTHGDPVRLWIRLEDGSVRTGLRQLENNRAPYDLDGRLVGEATFELPADLPLGYHELHLQLGSSDISSPIVVSPASLEPPAGTRHGAWPPSCTVSARKILGHRRFDGSDRPCRVVGGTARRGFHSRQSVARRRADRADGAVAVPADLAPIRQPDVPAGGGDPGVRLRPAPRAHPQGPGVCAGTRRRSHD